MLRKLAYLCIWSVIFFLAIVGYSYRHELSAVKSRVMAELLPGKGFQGQPDSMSFPIGADGHFHIRAVLDGTPQTSSVTPADSDLQSSQGKLHGLVSVDGRGIQKLHRAFPTHAAQQTWCFHGVSMSLFRVQKSGKRLCLHVTPDIRPDFSSMGSTLK